MVKTLIEIFPYKKIRNFVILLICNRITERKVYLTTHMALLYEWTAHVSK